MSVSGESTSNSYVAIEDMIIHTTRTDSDNNNHTNPEEEQLYSINIRSQQEDLNGTNEITNNNTTNLEAEPFYSITIRSSQEDINTVINEVAEEPDDEDNTNEKEIEVHNILSILWRNGKMGAAYYSLTHKILYVYEEVIDLAPQYLAARTIYREIDPLLTVTFGSLNDEFVKTLIDTVFNCVNDETVSSNSVRSLPPNLNLLSDKEYSFAECKAIVSELNIASMSMVTAEAKRLLYIQSLINFDNKLSVNAAGALVKYLEKNWAFFSVNKDELQFLHIQQLTMQKHVLMDWASFSTLQVFQQRSHDCNFKRGLQSSSREGISLFKILSTHCTSKLGMSMLKNIMLNPTRDIEELNKRLDFINFVLTPSNRDFIESLQDNLKHIHDVHKILTKIQNSRANSSNWKNIYQIIYQIIYISELSSIHQHQSLLLSEFCESITEDLVGLERTINSSLDFTVSNRRDRPAIKFGLDEILDAKLLRKQDISKHITAAARIAANELPDFINECTIIYLPEMGHLIAIKEWESDCNPDDLQSLGYQFVFNLKGTIHYKNPMCVELDTQLGHINANIIAHENRIRQRLGGFVLKYNKDIRGALRLLAQIDCLISIALVAKENNYVRPNLNEDRVHEIKKGRHPLMELGANFVPNDFYSGGNHSHVKILTGPNGSGKSMFLKQVGILIYMAHIGSYVPAKEANIGMVHSIHSRMQVAESACVRMSSFMMDISLATQALENAKPASLVIMDEFGRGTLGDDATILLTCALKKFLRQKEYCPHIIISTHLIQFAKNFPFSPLLQHIKTDHEIREDALVFLFKISKGISESLAFEMAKAAGLDENIVDRAREMFSSLQSCGQVTEIRPIVENRRYPNVTVVDVNFFNDIDASGLLDDTDENSEVSE